VAFLLSGGQASLAQENTEPAIIEGGGTEDALQTRTFGDTEIVVGEVIVRYTAASDPAERADAREAVDVEEQDPLLLPRTEVLDLGPGQSVEGAIQELEANPAVKAAEPNYVMELQTTPNDSLFGAQWGLHNTGQSVNSTTGTADADIDAPEAWERSTGSEDVTVAVIDTGVDLEASDLSPNLWTNPGESGDGNGLIDDVNGWDFAEDDNDPDDETSGHGSHVAGIIGAQGNNGAGVAGVNWETSLVPMRASADYSRNLPLSATIDAIYYAGRIGADVANGSYGGRRGPSEIERDALESAPETLFVYSAGNDGLDNDTNQSHPCNYAASLENVVCVAATDQNDGIASFSNFGEKNVDLGAPGVNIDSTSVTPRLESLNALFAAPGLQSPYSQSFDSDLGGWEFAGVGSTWARTNEAPFGSFGLSDSPGGNYANDVDSTATSPLIDLSDRANCALIFDAQTAVAPGDSLTIEASGDGGTSWRQIVAFGNVRLGTYGLQLGSVVDNQSDARLRLHLKTDSATTADGVHFDFPEIGCHPESTGNFVFLNGTSMAAPHVAGAAALLKSLAGQAPATALEDRLLATVDPLTALDGKTTTGGRLNLEHATRPPETEITSSPPQDGQPSQTITFETDEENLDNGTTFECRVDSEPFGSCAAEGADTRTYSIGEHIFEVRATWYGNADPTPASVTFGVDNQPPTAVADSYTATEDTPLHVAAPGVLGNDTDPNSGDTPTAVLDSGPSHAASFTLNADGSFDYTPEANFSGSDSFTYKAKDPDNAESNSAKVTITVRAVNDEPTITVAAGGSCSGTGVSGTMNLTVADVDSPVGSLSLSGGSSKTTLVPNGNITFGGSGADRTVTMTAVPQKTSQSADITITVNDGAATNTTPLKIKVIVGTDKKETIGGTGSADMIFGLNGDDTINASDGNDLACGGNGNDTLRGQVGNDTLSGELGNDRLEGGSNDDMLTGGAGADFFSGGEGTDAATDFTPSQGDTKDNTIP
jgi:subtilisin family serine protease